MFLEPGLYLEQRGVQEPPDMVCFQCACNLSGSSLDVGAGWSICSLQEEGQAGWAKL